MGSGLSKKATTPKTRTGAVRINANMKQSPAGNGSGIGKSSVQGGYKTGNRG